MKGRGSNDNEFIYIVHHFGPIIDDGHPPQSAAKLLTKIGKCRNTLELYMNKDR